jgi:hypothetical protein
MPKFLALYVLEAEPGNAISSGDATHVCETNIHLGSRRQDYMFHHFLTGGLVCPILNFGGRKQELKVNNKTVFYCTASSNNATSQR